MKIVIPDDFPSFYDDYPEALGRLRQLGDLTVHQSRAESEAELIERLVGETIVLNVRSYSAFTAEVIAALPGLRVVSINGTGVDNFDLEACSDNGVVVTNTPGGATTSVAELTMALMFAAARHIALADRRVRGGDWYHQHGIELRGKTLGVVGLGLIGQEVVRFGRALGMRVIAWSFRDDAERAASLGVEQVGLEDLMRGADVVSIHLRNSPESRGLIGEPQMAMMKPTSILVNTARAAIVDQEALLEALQSRRIAAAGIDVWAPEPIPAGSPWLELDNVVISPHVGWITDEAAARLAIAPVENIEAYLAGHPVNVVNPRALEHEKQRGLRPG